MAHDVCFIRLKMCAYAARSKHPAPLNVVSIHDKISVTFHFRLSLHNYHVDGVVGTTKTGLAVDNWDLVAKCGNDNITVRCAFHGKRFNLSADTIFGDLRIVPA